MKRIAIFALLVLACAAPGERDLRELVMRDSTYFEPETMLPFTGTVFRSFPDAPSEIEIDGEMLEGAWHGELRVYHRNGRIRYMGSFSRGERCGPWTENIDSLPPANIYVELTSEIESLGVYPPCPSDG